MNTLPKCQHQSIKIVTFDRHGHITAVDECSRPIATTLEDIAILGKALSKTIPPPADIALKNGGVIHDSIQCPAIIRLTSQAALARPSRVKNLVIARANGSV